MNRRKQTNCISLTDLKAIQASDERATAIGKPLNVLITLHPRNTRTMTLEERLAANKRIRDQYTEFARRYGSKPTWLYTREVALETLAEHMHMLCHVPAKHHAKFLTLANGWGDEPDACHARAASTKGYWSRRGYWFSDLLYICKQMSPQAKFGRPYWRIAKGPIIGARWGASRNIKGG